MKNTCLTVSVVCLLLVTATSASAANWPRFRGPDGAGHSDAKTVPVKFTADDYNWRVKLPGPGYSSPSIWEGGIYLTCLEGGRLTVVRLGTGDGRVVWQQKIDVDDYGQHRDNSFAAPTPALDADGVYLTFVSGRQRFAIGFDHAGRQLWRKPIGPYKNRHGAGASAIVIDGLVIVPNESEIGGSSITALDTANGAVKWKLDRNQSPKGSFATPTIYRNAKGSVELICAGNAHGITSVDPKEGQINWQLATGFTNRCVGSPVVADGLIFQTAGSGGGGKESAVLRPGSTDGAGKPVIVYDNLRRALPYVPTAIAVGELLFMWADSGIVTCIKAASGEEVWQQRVGGNYYSSPICINGNIYNVSRSGELVVIVAGDKFKELARVDLGEPAQASPAVADGVLYLRTNNHLISVGAGAKKN